MALPAHGQDTRSFELVHVDRQLNANYTRLMARLSPSDKQLLRQAQREWIKMRDLDCAVWSGNGLDCLIMRTDERAAQLKEMNDLLG